MTGLEYVAEPNATAYEILKTVINEHPECVEWCVNFDSFMVDTPYTVSGRFNIDFKMWEEAMQKVRPPQPVKPPEMEVYDGT